MVFRRVKAILDKEILIWRAENGQLEYEPNENPEDPQEEAVDKPNHQFMNRSPYDEEDQPISSKFDENKWDAPGGDGQDPDKEDRDMSYDFGPENVDSAENDKHYGLGGLYQGFDDGDPGQENNHINASDMHNANPGLPGTINGGQVGQSNPTINEQTLGDKSSNEILLGNKFSSGRAFVMSREISQAEMKLEKKPLVHQESRHNLLARILMPNNDCVYNSNHRQLQQFSNLVFDYNKSKTHKFVFYSSIIFGFPLLRSFYSARSRPGELFKLKYQPYKAIKDILERWQILHSIFITFLLFFLAALSIMYYLY